MKIKKYFWFYRRGKILIPHGFVKLEIVFFFSKYANKEILIPQGIVNISSVIE